MVSASTPVSRAYYKTLWTRNCKMLEIQFMESTRYDYRPVWICKRKDFFLFYKATYQCIKGFCQDIEFCFPPTYYIVSEEHTNWYLHFLDWCKSNDCLPDCLSFTYYDTRLLSSKNYSKESFVCIHYEPFGKSDGLKDFVMQVLRERRQLGLKIYPFIFRNGITLPVNRIC